MKRRVMIFCVLTLCVVSVFAAGGKKLTLYLVRHGETIMNMMDKAQGWADGVLTEKGVTGAVNMGKGLRNIKFESVYSSDLKRASDTAQIAMTQNKATKKWTVKEMMELREMGFGVFEGGTNEEMFLAAAKAVGLTVPANATTGQVLGLFMSLYQGSYAKMLEGMADANKKNDTKFQLAEDAQDVHTRVKRGIATIVAENPKGGNVMVVAHGLAIMFAVMDMGIDLAQFPPQLANSSVTKIVYDFDTGTYELSGTAGDMSYAEAGAKL